MLKYLFEIKTPKNESRLSSNITPSMGGSFDEVKLLPDHEGHGWEKRESCQRRKRGRHRSLAGLPAYHAWPAHPAAWAPGHRGFILGPDGTEHRRGCWHGVCRGTDFTQLQTKRKPQYLFSRMWSQIINCTSFSHQNCSPHSHLESLHLRVGFFMDKLV